MKKSNKQSRQINNAVLILGYVLASWHALCSDLSNSLSQGALLLAACCRTVAPNPATKKAALRMEVCHGGIHLFVRCCDGCYPFLFSWSLLRKLGLHVPVPMTRESALLASYSEPYLLLPAPPPALATCGYRRGSRAPGF